MADCALRGDVCGVRADKIAGLARGWTLALECLRGRLVVKPIVGQR